MLEIKFRGKRVDTGEWIYGSLTHVPGYEISIIDYNSPSYGRYDVDPETVGQYVCLTDKNDKEIYDGDICRIANLFAGDEFEKYKHRLNLIGKIVYINAAYVFETMEHGDQLLFLHLSYENMGSDMSFDDYIDSNDLEVIGNVFEHPHLLEK